MVSWKRVERKRAMRREAFGSQRRAVGSVGWWKRARRRWTRRKIPLRCCRIRSRHCLRREARESWREVAAAAAVRGRREAAAWVATGRWREKEWRVRRQ